MTALLHKIHKYAAEEESRSPDWLAKGVTFTQKDSSLFFA